MPIAAADACLHAACKNRHHTSEWCVTCEVCVDGAEAAWDSVLAFLVGMTASCFLAWVLVQGVPSVRHGWHRISASAHQPKLMTATCTECHPKGNMQMDQLFAVNSVKQLLFQQRYTEQHGCKLK